jgi:hypothetical protein
MHFVLLPTYSVVHKEGSVNCRRPEATAVWNLTSPRIKKGWIYATALTVHLGELLAYQGPIYRAANSACWGSRSLPQPLHSGLPRNNKPAFIQAIDNVLLASQIVLQRLADFFGNIVLRILQRS